MLSISINGCNGKMGQEVISQMNEYGDMILLNGFDKENTGNFPFPVYTNFSKVTEYPDVIIDFSVPVATLSMLPFAKVHHIPVVIATTGFSEEQQQQINAYAKDIPIFQSSNMSFEIHLMTKVLKMVSLALADSADIEIIETHHNRKIDAPSGTALMLANSINKVLQNRYTYDFDRMQKTEKRSQNEIGFSSIRGGNIVGEHTVQFLSQNETFEITHKAYSRKVFADGSLKAAQFLKNKPNGLYSMDDLI